MCIDSWYVEIHGTLRTGLSSRLDKEIDAVQRDVFYGGSVRSWQNGKTQVFIPSADNDVVLVFTHFIKHFYKGEGVCICQVCDWMRLLWKYQKTIDYNNFRTELSRKLRLLSAVPARARSSVMKAREMDYVEAAKAAGSGNLRIIFKDIIPNAIGPIIVETTQSLSNMILEASGHSYIGMGVQPPNPEWGAMLSEAREVMRTYPYLITIPGIFIIITALSFNLFGDGLRDAIDPRLKT